MSDARHSPEPLLISRRTVVGVGAKLIYAAPVIVGSYQLETLRVRASADVISGVINELPTCTPSTGPEETPTIEPTATPSSGSEETPSSEPTSTPTAPDDGVKETPDHDETPVVDNNPNDDDDEIFLVRFLPQTGDGGSLPLLEPHC